MPVRNIIEFLIMKIIIDLVELFIRDLLFLLAARHAVFFDHINGQRIQQPSFSRCKQPFLIDVSAVYESFAQIDMIFHQLLDSSLTGKCGVFNSLFHEVNDFFILMDDLLLFFGVEGYYLQSPIAPLIRVKRLGNCKGHILISVCHFPRQTKHLVDMVVELLLFFLRKSFLYQIMCNTGKQLTSYEFFD